MAGYKDLAYLEISDFNGLANAWLADAGDISTKHGEFHQVFYLRLRSVKLNAICARQTYNGRLLMKPIKRNLNHEL